MDATSSADPRGTDPFEALIADGRVGVRPSIPYKDATILTINFAFLEKKIQSLLLGAYLNHEPLRKYYYSGGAPDLIISSMITKDIACLTRYAILALYNRLRTVAEFYCPFAVANRMLDNVTHISPRMEFPTFLSSLLSSIGALRISYSAPKDVLVVYAPSADDTYIKSLINKHEQGSHDRLITNLRLCGVGLSSLDYDHLEGAFWTTCFVTDIEGTDLLKVSGTVDPTNYVNEDIVRSLALLDSKGQNPFEGIVGLIVGYTNNAAVVAAVAADVPPNIPEGFPSDKAPNRLVGWTYNVSLFGIQPASLGNPSGVYIVGRGSIGSYTCILGLHLTPGEVSSVLRYRLLAPPELTKSEREDIVRL